MLLLGGSRVAELHAGADISYLSAFPGEAEVLFPVRCGPAFEVLLSVGRGSTALGASNAPAVQPLQIR